jgi:hypothetical protein
MSKLQSFRYNVVDAIASRLMTMAEPPGSFQKLESNERTVVLVWNAIGLIGNVGLKEFLKAGHDASKLATAFAAIGEKPISDAMRNAATIVSEDQETEVRLNELETIIYNRDDDVESALFQFIKTKLYPEP